MEKWRDGQKVVLLSPGTLVGIIRRGGTLNAGRFNVALHVGESQGMDTGIWIWSSSGTKQKVQHSVVSSCE
jgi:hypothetical protein